MTDDDKVPSIDVDAAIERALGKLEKGVGKADVEDAMRSLRRELKDEMDSLHATDRKDREELRAKVGEIDDFLKELKKMGESKTKESSSTIVVPASQIPTEEPKGDEKPADESTGSEPAPKKRLRFW